MKVSEFEEKLTTVSDAKLIQMLSAGRRDGPDIAVKLILSEGHRRGLEGLDAENPPEETGKGTKAYPKHEHQGAASEYSTAGDSHASEATGSEGAPTDGEAPAGSANWLSEETSASKVPAAIKVVLYIAALGGLVFGALKFIHRG